MGVQFTDPNLTEQEQELIRSFLRHVSVRDDDQNLLTNRFLLDAARKTALRLNHPDPGAAENADPVRLATRTRITQEINDAWALLKGRYFQGDTLRWPFRETADAEGESGRAAARTLREAPRAAVDLDPEIPFTDILFVRHLKAPDVVVLSAYFHGYRVTDQVEVRRGSHTDGEFDRAVSDAARAFLVRLEPEIVGAAAAQGAYTTTRIHFLTLTPEGLSPERRVVPVSQLHTLLFPSAAGQEKATKPRSSGSRWAHTLSRHLEEPHFFGPLSDTGLLVVQGPRGHIFFGYASVEPTDGAAALSLFLQHASQVDTVGEALRVLQANGINFDHTPTVVIYDGEVTRIGIAAQPKRPGRRNTFS